MEEGSVYSFTSYNSSHYSDATYRSNRKTNTYLFEMNQKIKEDKVSLVDMEEGIVALSNFLNGIEEKRPTVSELIGSRINLDECLKLKLQIREKIRKTKNIRKDLFISTLPSSNNNNNNNNNNNGMTSVATTPINTSPQNTVHTNLKSKSNQPGILVPQTSRISTSNSNIPTLSASPSPINNSNSNSNSNNLKSKEHDVELKTKSSQKAINHFTFSQTKVLPSTQTQTSLSISTSNSTSSLPTSSIITPSTSNLTRPSTTSSLSISDPEKIQLQPIENNLKNQNLPQQNQIQHQTSSSSLIPPTPHLHSSTPLITPVIPPVALKGRKPLVPIDELADRQLAWLLSIEAKNRLAKKELESQTLRELKVVPDVQKAQKSWLKVKKLYKKKFGIDVDSRRDESTETLSSIDEDSQTLDTSNSRISNKTLLDKIPSSISFKKSKKSHKLHHQNNNNPHDSNVKNRNSTLEPISSSSSSSSSLSTLQSNIIDQSSTININTNPIKEEYKKQVQKSPQMNLTSFDSLSSIDSNFDSSGNHLSIPITSSFSSSIAQKSSSQVIDCETPRIPSWTDLIYEDIPISKPAVLQPLHLDRHIQDKEEYAVTSRSDESDYEQEWHRANLKLMKINNGNNKNVHSGNS